MKGIEMRSKFLPYFCIVLLLGCASSKPQSPDSRVRIKRFKESNPTGFHKEVEMKIGWLSYEAGKVDDLHDSLSVINFDESQTVTGKVPVIILSYPDSSNTLTLVMNIDDALLGKLLKHSLMTEIPIKRPLSEFIKEADCSKCHPADIKLN